jgi:hypothetical protein
MLIQEALKETGKAFLSIESEYYAMEGGDSLNWISKKTSTIDSNVPFVLIMSDQWQPYHEVEEIRPEKAGELWKNASGNILVIMETPDREGLFFTYTNDAHKPTLLRNMIWSRNVIHNESGWTLIYSPDKEVMKKIKELEDNSVETIEIEDVLWNTNDECTYPYQEKSVFDWDVLLNMKPIKLICVIPKEGK